ncbi:PR domain zinc finger protein 1-like isoform X1 [Leptotrombidium deliense]|uniref:PR domain zinc finger protein 1-like isoform X1 n=1 Tax=Leptotrombidium deliense TaxID=299467 RepID=A0A443S1C1_9ACAR|nr:PR domain zinc finger protein 1-like isoform X1 [Leptotrombidium deliense]
MFHKFNAILRTMQPFEKLTVYMVADQPCDAISQADYIQVAHILDHSSSQYDIPKEANHKYFWRVFNDEEDYHYIDAYEVSKANWMRSLTRRILVRFKICCPVKLANRFLLTQ